MTQFWQLEIDSQQVAWLQLDCPKSSVNTLSVEVIEALEQQLAHIETQNYCGLVIYSGKEKGFIAGADIKQFVGFAKDEQAVLKMIQRAQAVFSRLEALPMPTVAMIEGFCLGGGCELALACDYRVAADTVATKIGLPEVKLGIQPGWGGSVRLPRLIGVLPAMGVMLAGRVVSAARARSLKIVDCVAPVRTLRATALFYVLKKPAKQHPGWKAASLAWPGMRSIVGVFLRRTLRKKVQQTHYPAPYGLVEQWVAHGAKGQAAFTAEAHGISALMVSDTCQNLVRVFFLQERLKSFAKVPVPGSIRRVHVIGAGTMGGDIAAWCALKGFHVTLQDQSIDKIAPAMVRARALFAKKCPDRSLRQQAMDRLVPDVLGDGLTVADWVIEAVFESVKIKHEVLRQMESRAPAKAVLATNTSSIPLEQLAQAMKEQQRLVGIHFFNPVSMMPLIEVVKTAYTAESSVQAALAFVGRLAKLPLPVASSPGFLVNRILMPYMMEAVRLLEEGVDAQVIDQAAVDFGMPMGPVHLADQVGLDVCACVAQNLSEKTKEAVPQLLQEKVQAGHLGVKTGSGFYQYRHKKRLLSRVASHAADKKDIQERLLKPLAETAAQCLEEGVVADADLLDAGLVFGTGFAPFRGGLMHYLKSKTKESSCH